MLNEDTPAGLWVRLLAVVVDAAVLSAVFFPVTRVVKGVWLMSAGDHRWTSGWFVTDPLCLAFLAAMFLYFVLLEGLIGATLGKRALGLRVVGDDGRPPGLSRAVVRNLLRAVDSLPAFGILAAVLITSSDDRTRLGDRVAGTWVVRTTAGKEVVLR